MDLVMMRPNYAKNINDFNRYGGEKGIRTLETVARLHTFQACAFDHSAISPQAGNPRGAAAAMPCREMQLKGPEIPLRRRAHYTHRSPLRKARETGRGAEPPCG